VISYEDMTCQECGHSLRGTPNERAAYEDGLTLCQFCIDDIEEMA
jgi:formylmethanofuran dehydrogenase subunit E